MDETRTLRDKLEQAQNELRRLKEHLEKLRAHHAREKDSLEQQLEDTRRELAELKARAGMPGGPSGRPAPQPPAPRTEAARGALHPPSNFYVALARSPGPGDDEALRQLSRVSALPLADLRMRMAAHAPIILTLLPPAEAERLVRELRAAGFAAVSCERAAASPLLVRRFHLEDSGLGLELGRGERLQVSWDKLHLLVRGRRTLRTVETTTETEVVVNHNRGFLDPTRRQRVQKQAEVTHEELGLFVWAYGPDFRAAFTSATDFSGLGAQRGLSRNADLQVLAGELRRRAPHVTFDDRLMRFPSLSMPLVDPERTHELFAELLWQAVRDGVL